LTEENQTIKKRHAVAYRRTAVIEEFVGDGDTVDLQTNSRFPVRFLGIDAAEKGLFRPKRIEEPLQSSPTSKPTVTSSYATLEYENQSELWDEFVTDPFVSGLSNFTFRGLQIKRQ